MNKDYEILKREIEALDTASIYLRTPNNKHLFSKSSLEFLEEIRERAERIRNMADEQIKNHNIK
jgi:hypothetical protein